MSPLEGRPAPDRQPPDDELVIRLAVLPGGQPWAYRVNVLVIAPEIDEATAARWIAQVTPPRLTKCDTCGAPMYEGSRCGLCAWDALPEGSAV